MKISDSLAVGPSPGPPESVNAPGFTLVIATRNRPQSLSRCLRSVLNGQVTPDEIVIIDQGEQFSAEESVSPLADTGIPMRYIKQDPLGLAVAQNIGIEVARYEWIAVTDDDCIVHEHWLEAITKAAAAGGVDAITGRVLPQEVEADKRLPVSSRVSCEARLFVGKSAPWHVGSGNNFAVRKSTFLRLGGCDQRLGPGSPGLGGVDMDLFYRLLRSGVKIWYEPSALVFHERQTFLQRKLRRPMYGYGMGACFGLWLMQKDFATIPLMFDWALLRLAQVVKPKSVSRWAAFREEASILRATIAGLSYGVRSHFRPSSRQMEYPLY